MAELRGSRPEEVGEYLVNNYDILGRGAFGVVTTGTNNKGETIAAKRISLEEERKAGKISQELDRFKTLDHPHIVGIFDVYRNQSVLWIMMEYCQLKTLKHFFPKVKENLQEQVSIMLQIAQGIQYLHSKDIIHRGIKPANILVSQEKPVVVKLTDFDFSKFHDPDYESSCMSSNVGTPDFKAPEYFQRFQEGDKVHIAYHRNVDIFAAGLTFLAMIQGNEGLVPRIETGEDESEMFQTIGQLIHQRTKSKKKNLEILQYLEIVQKKTSASYLTQEIRELIREMTRAEPKDRVGATEVVRRLKILKPLFFTFGVTMDTKHFIWNPSCFTVMGTGHIVFWGQSSIKSPTALHMFLQGPERFEKVREVKSFCKHEVGVFLEPVKMKDQEFLAVSCIHCRKIRLYDMNRDVVTRAFHNPEYRPWLMSAGEDGVMYVMDFVNGVKPVLKLNTEQIPFTGPHQTIQPGSIPFYRMIHIPAPHNLLMFCHSTAATIRAVSSITGEEKWELWGEVEGRQCHPHGMFFSRDHQALLVADSWNRRILRLDPRDGSVIQSISLNSIHPIHNIFVYQQKLIVRHVVPDRISVFDIEYHQGSYPQGYLLNQTAVTQIVPKSPVTCCRFITQKLCVKHPDE